jgi:hypothetical protein
MQLLADLVPGTVGAPLSLNASGRTWR